MRLRLLPLLFLSAFAPAVLAQSIDLRASLSMPPATTFNAYPQFGGNNSLIGWGTANGTLTLINAGSAPAERVTFELHGLGLVGSGDATIGGPWGITCITGPKCTVLVLPPGSMSLSVQATWSYVTAVGKVETTSATVSGRSPDPDLTNNTASADTTFFLQSDVTLNSLNVPSSVAAGQNCLIAAHSSNPGPGPATDMSLTVSIPPGARYEGYLGQPWFDCAEPPVGGHGDLVCTAPSIGLTGDDVVAALVNLDPSLAPGSVLTTNATLTSTSTVKSPQTASGSLTVTAPTPTSADAAVSIAATLDKPSVVFGDWVTETYTVSNAGPRDAELVTIDIRPPRGFTQWGKPTIGSCNGFGPSPIRCTVPTLAPGATMSLTVQLQTYATGTFTSTAAASWLRGSPIAASNALVVTSARRHAARH